MPVPVPPQLDHLIFGVPDLDRGIDLVERLFGVRPERGGRHEAFGTRNALLSLGDDRYFEIIAPDPDATNPPRPRILGLDDVTVPQLVAWVARSERDLETRAAESRAAGIDLGSVLAGSRTRPDGTRVSWTCTDPAAVAVPGIRPFLIDWGNTPSPAGSAPPGCRLAGFAARHPHPEQERAALLALGLDVAVAFGDRPALHAKLETPRGTISLTPAPPE